MDTYIKGTYRKLIYTNNKGYIIGIFKVKETNMESMINYIGKTVTFTGYFGDINIDDNYIFYGEDMTHPKYGYQFVVNRYERLLPSDTDGIVMFLSSDLFPGIGEKMAQKIVDTLGDSVLELILSDFSCLYKVPKLSGKKIEMIYNNLSKNEESHTIIVRLNELGFTNKESIDIYNKYNSKTMDIINSNMYSIIKDLEISFKKIDMIAVNYYKVYDSIERITACAIYILKSNTFLNGDTYMYFDNLYSSTVRYLKIDLDSISFKNYLNIEDIVIVDDKYYLADIYDAEEEIVFRVHNLLKYDNSNYSVDNYIEKMESKLRIEYNDKQKEAITKAINNNLLIITGGPGTGKTTIIKAICDIYQLINDYSYQDLLEDIALLAPTGRASKRMAESTNLYASTIHRFLKWNKEDNSFQVNRDNKSQVKLIIVDEASMIDIPLFKALLDGVSIHTKIILVGDHNQLPSVGPGTLLKDLIDTEIIDTVYLDLLYRQEEDSYINRLACDIKDNSIESNFLEKKDDYNFLKVDSSMIVEYLKETCRKFINAGYDYKRLQVMAPMYSGNNGIDNLNHELQEIFNPKDINKRELKYGDIIYRENDKILELVNMPDLNIYNGDIGTIKYIIYKDTSKSKKDEIHVDYDGVLVKYTTSELNKIKHGFVISIHKSQGSEFDTVIMPICNNYKRMLYRKLIYTAITRAKKKLIIIGEPNSFIYGVSNNNEYQRNTNLCEKLLKF